MKDLKACYILCLLAAPLCLSGCWAAAVGVGAEAGYVATQSERTAKETISDQFLTAAIKTKFLADPQVSGMDINVDSFKGVVTLRGALRSQVEINKAMALAQSVSGVQKVENKLVLVN